MHYFISLHAGTIICIKQQVSNSGLEGLEARSFIQENTTMEFMTECIKIEMSTSGRMTNVKC